MNKLGCIAGLCLLIIALVGQRGEMAPSHLIALERLRPELLALEVPEMLKKLGKKLVEIQADLKETFYTDFNLVPRLIRENMQVSGSALNETCLDFTRKFDDVLESAKQNRVVFSIAFMDALESRREFTDIFEGVRNCAIYSYINIISEPEKYRDIAMDKDGVYKDDDED